MQNFLYQTTSDTQAYEAYKLYVALKNHFNSKTYDFFKYGGRSKASKKTFDNRSDKYFFYKLADRKDKIEFLVSNFVGSASSWIGDLVNNETSEKNYRDFVKYRDSMTYMSKEDLSKMDPDFDKNFAVEKGKHPLLLRLFLRSDIRLETMVILDGLCNYSRKWSRRINEDVVWPTVHLKIKRFKPFVEYEEAKMKKIVVDYFKKQ